MTVIGATEAEFKHPSGVETTTEITFPLTKLENDIVERGDAEP